MFNYGIGETAERETKRPARSRVMRARASYRINKVANSIITEWAVFATLALLFALVLAYALTLDAQTLESVRTNPVQIFVLLALTLVVGGATLGTVCYILATETATARTAKRYRAIIARADNAHALELGKLSKQLLTQINYSQELGELLADANRDNAVYASALLDAKINNGELGFANYGKDND